MAYYDKKQKGNELKDSERKEIISKYLTDLVNAGRMTEGDYVKFMEYYGF